MGSRAPVKIAASGIANPDEILEMDLDQKAENFGFNLVANGWESTLDVYKGKVIIINVWATWCGPCLDEIPHLNRLQEAYRDKGLVVISLSDEARSELQSFEELLPMTSETGYADGSKRMPKPIQEAFTIRPTSYIVDRQGNYRKYILGARDYAYFERAIQPYL
jgi:thiol-disulfide isomerase/thioredoxin